MAEDGDDVLGPRAGGHPAAIGMALGANPETAVDARAYLREQTELARLQKANLLEQNAFELSHLRWRRFNDQMKGALQIMLVAVGLVAVAALAAAIWNASQADGIVVDSFSVPPQFAAAGIAGDVVADDLTGRIGAVRDIADGHSFDNSKDVRKNRDDDVKVEIPETGVSLTQLWRYLKLWLGNERHVSGNVRLAAGGQIALTISLDGQSLFTASGLPDDLGKLEQQAAEHIFAAVEPINVVLYYDWSHRPAEALAAVERAAASLSNPRDISDAYSLWSFETRRHVGDMALTAARIRLALAANPNAAAAHVMIVRTAIDQSHDEEGLAAARAIAGLRREHQPMSQRGRGFDEIQIEAAFERAYALADYAQLLNEPCDYCSAARMALSRTEFSALLHDAAGSRRFFMDALADGTPADANVVRGRYFANLASRDWPAAAADARAYRAALEAGTALARPLKDLLVRSEAAPLLAVALAGAGDIGGARGAIAPTPMDCDRCLVARGDIETVARNWRGAAAWYDRAAKHAPSTPFADSNWGRMLLAKGDLDAAIAKLALANQKGPHFADPLEMWGEALTLKNRSDLALAKFEEANKYAPNWGRLHMKWGEALGYVGRRDEARAQFHIASTLDLSVADKAELARDMRGSG